MLADLNTELTMSQVDNFHYGDHQTREEEDAHTQDFLSLFSEANIFLPSTFCSHTGEIHTFTGITKK